MAKEQPVENLMRSTMENLRDMIDANTVIGEPIETKDGTYIIPVSKLSFGFVSAGSEFSSSKNESDEKSFPFGGGSGSGVSLKPITFLVIKDDIVRLMHVEHETTYDKLADNIPQVLDMIKNFINDFSSKKKNNPADTTPACGDFEKSTIH